MTLDREKPHPYSRNKCDENIPRKTVKKACHCKICKN